MALDILVVDDERDIRELVAGVLSDEGYECRTAGDSDRALAMIDERRPEPRAARRLAARQPDGRAGSARRDQGARTGPAGHHLLRPWQHRHRGFRGQPRGDGLHRKAVRGGTAAACSSTARPRPSACAARMHGCAKAWPSQRRVHRQFQRHQRRARDAEARRQHRQPRADQRSCRGGQGSRRAPAACLEPARRQGLRHGQFRAHHARAVRAGTVRRGSRRQAGARRAAGTGRWRHALSRRGGGHAARARRRASCAC